MLWGCFGWYREGYTPKIDDTIDSNLYVSILEDGLQKSLNYWDKNAQGKGNNPKHTNKEAKTWLKDHDFKVIVWPP